MNYDNLIQSISGQNFNWEIVEISLSDLVLPPQVKPYGRKLQTYIRLLEENKMLPPIVVNEKNEVIDGMHRYQANFYLGSEKVPVIRRIGTGLGLVLKDEYFDKHLGEFEFYYKDIVIDQDNFCLICNGQLEYAPPGSSITGLAEFPDGMPAGPFFFCRYCGLIINPKKFIVWKPKSALH